ncbi:MAG: carboxymuconolactone decarboxylase family protein [Acidimicrobiia bacterium]|nr:carboxymuconolactone decarboxylase family protein [Acidimicrobiia bacterium]NNL47734.1 carboxymuconolactone decarboxylase family protein [Acidimicrobiia bacterium]
MPGLDSYAIIQAPVALYQTATHVEGGCSVSGHNHELSRTLAGQGRELRRLIPTVYEGFNQLSAAAMTEGALDSGTKELIALALAVQSQCDGCISAHARNTAREGVTRQAVAEMLGVTIMMGGGPGTVYAPRALAAFDEFSAT